MQDLQRSYMYKDPLKICVFKDLWQVFEDMQRSCEVFHQGVP